MDMVTIVRGEKGASPKRPWRASERLTARSSPPSYQGWRQPYGRESEASLPRLAQDGRCSLDRRFVMSSFGGILLVLGVLVIAVPLGWIAVNKLQNRSDSEYERQQDRLDQRYR